MNIELLQENIEEVFNDYNINILFTVFSLPCKVQMASLSGLAFTTDKEKREAMNSAAAVQYQANAHNQTAALQQMIVKAANDEQRQSLLARRKSHDANGSQFDEENVRVPK